MYSHVVHKSSVCHRITGSSVLSVGILGGEDADVKLVRGWRCCTMRYCRIGDGVLLAIVTFLGGCMDAVIVFRAAPKYVIIIGFIVVICIFELQYIGIYLDGIRSIKQQYIAIYCNIFYSLHDQDEIPINMQYIFPKVSSRDYWGGKTQRLYTRTCGHTSSHLLNWRILL
jgi:hypothetical protein